MAIKIKQTNFTSGVVDELLAAREDTVFYYNGLADANNLFVIPQGGVTRRPGMQHVAELKRKLEEIDLSGVSVTVPNGGTAENINDGDPDSYVTTSGNIGTTDPCVIVQFDFSEPVSVDAVDIINYKLSSGSLADEFFVRYSDDGSSWTVYGSAFNWDATDRSRRRSSTETVTARYWHIVRVGSTDIAATASIGEVKFWAQTDDLSAGKLVPFSYSTEEVYMMAVSDRNIDVFVGDDLKGHIAVPHTHDHVDVLNWTQSYDTLLLFHGDVWTQRVFRQGDDDEFDFRNVSWSNIPKHDFGAGIGGVDEVQTLGYVNLSSGDKFTILLEGKRTAVIAAAATDADTAAAIQSELRGLSNTAADGISVSDDTDKFTVTFSGDDGTREWGEMSVSVLSGNSVWSVSRTTEGELPGEDIISDTRGHPRCGVIYQERLHVGGFKSLPNAIGSSVLGEFYNLDIDRDADTRGLLFRATADQVAAVYQLVAGRNLSVFTNDGEFFALNEPISVDTILKLSTGVGTKEGIRVHEVEGALIFIEGVEDEDSDDGREVATSFREFLFVDTEQSYTALDLSKLARDQIKNPVSVAKRRKKSKKDADMLLAVNDDGTGTAFTVLRSDQVNAFMPFSTRAGDRLFDVRVDKRRRVFFIVEREINGVKRRFIERWNDDLLLDGGGIFTVTAESFTAAEGQEDFVWTFDNPSSVDEIGVRVDGGRLGASEYSVDLGSKTVTLSVAAAAGQVVRVAKMVNEVTGLDHLAGEEVQTRIDGTAYSSFTVSETGVLSIGKYADTEIQYGFNYEVYGKLLPFRIPESETLEGEKMRCVEATFSLYQTGDLELRANDGLWQAVRLLQADSNVLDRSTDELLYTGIKKKEGLKGNAEGAPLEFRSVVPEPLTVRAVTRKVEF